MQYQGTEISYPKVPLLICHQILEYHRDEWNCREQSPEIEKPIYPYMCVVQMKGFN